MMVRKIWPRSPYHYNDAYVGRREGGEGWKGAIARYRIFDSRCLLNNTRVRYKELSMSTSNSSGKSNKDSHDWYHEFDKNLKTRKDKRES